MTPNRISDVSTPARATSPRPLAVRVRGVSKGFGGARVLEGVDLEIGRGEFVVLLGKSGSGKTTLLRILVGLEAPDAGSVRVPARRTVVFQEPRLVPSMRVLDNVLLGQDRGAANVTAARSALAEVGLGRHERAWPATLSGGEAQRAALARAFVRSPELLLLDEPFAALDALTRLTMQTLTRDLVSRHEPAVVLVTHDVGEAVRLADRVLVLHEGRFVIERAIDQASLDRARASELEIELLDALGVALGTTH